MPIIDSCEVIRSEKVGPVLHVVRFRHETIAASAQPGQFVNVLTREGFPPFLRKPFSVCRRNANEGWFEIFFKVVGTGTRLLAELQPGERRSIIGPLGNGFGLSHRLQQAIIVAGGIGVAPFPFLAEVLRQHEVTVSVYLGARTRDELWGMHQFAELADEVFISTDDGSEGFHGRVTEMLKPRLPELARESDRIQIFACGPEPMLKAVMQLGRQFNLPTQISVETMMGCGFGICMGCPMPNPANRAGQAYKLSCIDGPVFDIHEVEMEWPH
ncbi:MAG: dihydroorotate dehydrogenase electron transfer subunit [candidate division KSB1 bacterium]|nr:dihydroorotate dehydrogenase electron transfer subunit [candidate division KSB1 bacterium]